jgi:C-terminal processing protease CtpA/Prc
MIFRPTNAAPSSAKPQAAARPVAPYSIKNGLVAAIPFGRAVNPVTGTNWEGKGVQPDIRAKAADALPVAYQHLLQQLLEKPRDDEHRDTLQKTLELIS